MTDISFLYVVVHYHNFLNILLPLSTYEKHNTINLMCNSPSKFALFCLEHNNIMQFMTIRLQNFRLIQSIISNLYILILIDKILLHLTYMRDQWMIQRGHSRRPPPLITNLFIDYERRVFFFCFFFANGN